MPLITLLLTDCEFLHCNKIKITDPLSMLLRDTSSYLWRLGCKLLLARGLLSPFALLQVADALGVASPERDQLLQILQTLLVLGVEPHVLLSAVVVVERGAGLNTDRACTSLQRRVPLRATSLSHREHGCAAHELHRARAVVVLPRAGAAARPENRVDFLEHHHKHTDPVIRL